MQTITFFNPLSSQYHALEDFKTLKISQKIVTIALTIITALATLLIGTAAIFRLLVNHYITQVTVDKLNAKPPSPVNTSAGSVSSGDSKEIPQQIYLSIETVEPKSDLSLASDAAHKSPEFGVHPNSSATIIPETPVLTLSSPVSEEINTFSETEIDSVSSQNTADMPGTEVEEVPCEESLDLTGMQVPQLNDLLIEQISNLQTHALASAVSCAYNPASSAAETLFAESNESVETCRAAALAGLLRTGQIPDGYVPTPSPEELGIILPQGVSLQGYRCGNEVVVALQGPGVSENCLKEARQAVHQLRNMPYHSDNELNIIIYKVPPHLRETFDYQLEEDPLSLILTSKLTASESGGVSIVSEAGEGAKVGGVVSATLATAATATLAAAGFAAPPVALFIGGIIALTGTAAGAAAGLAKGGIKATVDAVKKNGIETNRPTISLPINAIKSYVAALKHYHRDQN